jgi:hypothetical protein
MTESVPRVCLDTVIHSGRTTKDLHPPEEMSATEEIERLHEAGLIKRVTTPVTKSEERRTLDAAKRAILKRAVPASPRWKHPRCYWALRSSIRALDGLSPIHL